MTEVQAVDVQYRQSATTATAGLSLCRAGAELRESLAAPGGALSLDLWTLVTSHFIREGFAGDGLKEPAFSKREIRPQRA
jgi:hypothetical protein